MIRINAGRFRRSGNMRTVLTTIGLLLALTVTGVIGFRLTLGKPWVDCLYLAVITLSTLGSENAGTTPASKLFVVFFMVTGMGIFTYSAFQIGSWIVSTDLRLILERRRMERNISRLTNHSIICGQGRMGLTICEYLSKRKRPFVVVDQNEERIGPVCRDNGWLYIVGDATSDEVLQRAGIGNAASLTTVLATDADNLYVVLSAKILNSELKIIARAVEEDAIRKLERAGATRVVSPLSTGAEKMARFMLNPSIEDFIEIADSHGNDLELADVQIEADSRYVGKQLFQTDFRSRGVMVIGIRRADGERLMPPPGDSIIHAEDSLFVFGNSENVNAVLDDDPDVAGV